MIIHDMVAIKYFFSVVGCSTESQIMQTCLNKSEETTNRSAKKKSQKLLW